MRIQQQKIEILKTTNKKALAMTMASCFLVACAMLLSISCEDKNKSTVATVTTTSPATSITQTGATVAGNISANGGAAVTESGVVYGTSTSPEISGSKVATSPNAANGAFTVSITGLTANTSYFARAYAKNSAGVAYGNEISFKTLAAPVAPTVTTTSPATSITQTGAMVAGNIVANGGADVTESGVVYGTSANPLITGSKVATSPNVATGAFTVSITGLTAGTNYVARAYAKNSVGVSYGADIAFATPLAPTAPTVTTLTATNVKPTSATVDGNISASGGEAVTESGVAYGTTENPDITGSKVFTAPNVATGTFTVNIAGLTAGTKYFARAYAKNSVGVSYGISVSFTTTTTPTVTTTSPATSSITQTGAIIGGNISTDGGDAITESGVAYGTAENPDITGSKVATSPTTTKGEFSVSLTGLTANTAYFARAYAKNSVGVSYGAGVTFKTPLAPTAPTITTAPATNVRQKSATVGGDITANGGADVTESGVVYNTSPNPDITNMKATTAPIKASGAFTLDLTGLSEGTTYYARAYAKNSVGISYGADVTFTTMPASTAPMVTTSPATEIKKDGATVGGSITSNGGADVTESGVVYGTSANPDITGTKVTTSPNVATGPFTINVTGLTQNTQYFARAYAKNSLGVSYGTEITFTPVLEFFTDRAAWGFEKDAFVSGTEIEIWSPSGRATAAIDATSGANGTSKSLKITFGQADEVQLNTWGFFGPAGGKTYTLSYWVKATENMAVQTWLRRPDNTGQVIFDDGVARTITTTWKKVSIDFTPPDGSTNLEGWKLQLKIVSSPASGSISFDEFSVIEK